MSGGGPGSVLGRKGGGGGGVRGKGGRTEPVRRSPRKHQLLIPENALRR